MTIVVLSDYEIHAWLCVFTSSNNFLRMGQINVDIQTIFHFCVHSQAFCHINYTDKPQMQYS